MNYFDRHQTGETLSIITNDVDTLCTSLNQVATQAVTSISTIIGVLYMMFSINWMMTLIALVILPVALFHLSSRFLRNTLEINRITLVMLTVKLKKQSVVLTLFRHLTQLTEMLKNLKSPTICFINQHGRASSSQV